MDSLKASDAEAGSHAVAPRVTLADIEAAIAERHDFPASKALSALGAPHNPALEVLSICILVMRNGFTVIGKSAPASPQNFNPAFGQKLAYEDCIHQLWPLMGFALRDKLAAPTGAPGASPVIAIARACHEVNRAYCQSQGDHSQPAWSEAPEWQRQSAMNGVLYAMGHPEAKPADSHESWLDEKRRDGWIYGPVKDPQAKTHPCFVPYDELPTSQKAKDYIFLAIVRMMTSAINPDLAAD